MSPPAPARSERRFALAVAAIFGALALAGVLGHEMWRDELEIWLIARASAGLRDLLANMRTEGHPALWYVVTWLLARITREPLAMQLLNVTIGTAAATIVAQDAPAPRWARALFVLGYLPLYEFTVITRSYALELLLLSAFCSRLARRRAIDGGAVGLLVLLAHTNLFGTIFAGLAVAFALVAAWRRPAGEGIRVSWIAASTVIVAVAVAFAHVLVQSLAIGSEHADSYRPPWNLRSVLACLGTLARGFVPLPDFGAHATWNSTALDLLPRGMTGLVGALGGAAALMVAARALRRVPEALLVFLTGSATLFAITLFVWFGFARHHGQHFVWFLACAWIAAALDPRARDSWNARTGRLGLAALLAIQALAGVHAYLRDLALPFSNARAVAHHIAASELQDLPLVGSIDYAVEPITAYLDRAMWYPESDRSGTFLDWSDRRRLVPATKALGDARALAEREGRDVILVLSYPWRDLPVGARVTIGDGTTMHLFARFRGALVADENYDLYRVSVEPR